MFCLGQTPAIRCFLIQFFFFLPLISFRHFVVIILSLSLFCAFALDLLFKISFVLQMIEKKIESTSLKGVHSHVPSQYFQTNPKNFVFIFLNTFINQNSFKQTLNILCFFVEAPFVTVQIFNKENIQKTSFLKKYVTFILFFQNKPTT